MSAANPSLSGFASLAMARHGLRARQASSVVLNALGNADATAKYVLLTWIYHTGGGNQINSTAVISILRDQRLPPIVRGRAATVLGHARTNCESVRGALLESLTIEDYYLIRGSATALSLQGAIPREAIRILISHLDNEREEVRIAAAYGLAAMKADAAPALDALLARVGREPNRGMCLALISALSAIGPTVCSAMLAIVKEGSPHRTWAANAVFRELGVKGIAPLIEAVRTDTDEWIRGAFVMVLREMGPSAAPALPALTDALDTCTNEELAICLIAAIYSTGRAGVAQVPAFLRAVLHGSKEMSVYAERAIKDIGRSALPAVTAARATATDAERAVIDKLLREMTTEDTGEFARFESIGNDSVVWTFVRLGHLLERSRDGLSFREIARKLEGDLDQMGSRSAPGVSEGTIRNHLAIVTKALGGTRLTSHLPRQRLGTLKAEGHAALAAARRYLQWKAEWLGHSKQS
jgi:HEAT repeat protein